MEGLSCRDVGEFIALERLEGPADYRRFDVLISWLVWSLAMWDKGKTPDFEDFIFRWCEESDDEKQSRIARQIAEIGRKLGG